MVTEYAKTTIMVAGYAKSRTLQGRKAAALRVR
jgi:hypothetical protein